MKDMKFFDGLDDSGKKTFASAFKPYFKETGDFDAAYEKGKAAVSGAQNEASRAAASTQTKAPSILDTALGWISTGINTAGNAANTAWNFMADPKTTINAGKTAERQKEIDSLKPNASYQSSKLDGMNYFDSLPDEQKHTYAEIYRTKKADGMSHTDSMAAGKAAVEQQHITAANENQARIDALEKLNAEQAAAEEKRDNMQAYAGKGLTGGQNFMSIFGNPMSWNKGSNLTVAEAMGGKTVTEKNAEERDALATEQGKRRTEAEKKRLAAQGTENSNQETAQEAKKGYFYQTASEMMNAGESETVNAFMSKIPQIMQTVEDRGVQGLPKQYRQLYLALVKDDGSFSSYYIKQNGKWANDYAAVQTYAQQELDAAQEEYQAAQDKTAQDKENALYQNYAGQVEKLNIAQENAAEIDAAEQRAYAAFDLYEKSLQDADTLTDEEVEQLQGYEDILRAFNYSRADAEAHYAEMRRKKNEDVAQFTGGLEEANETLGAENVAQIGKTMGTVYQAPNWTGSLPYDAETDTGKKQEMAAATLEEAQTQLEYYQGLLETAERLGGKTLRNVQSQVDYWQKVADKAAYDQMQNDPDFERLAEAGKTRYDKQMSNAWYGGWQIDSFDEMVNNKLYQYNEEWEGDPLKQQGQGQKYVFMTDEERKTFNYLKMKYLSAQSLGQDPTQYDPVQYMESLDDALTYRQSHYTAEQWANYSSQNAATAALGTLGTVVQNVGYSPLAIAQSLYDISQGEATNPYSQFYQGQANSEETQETVNQMIADATGDNAFAQWFWQSVYGAATSGVQSTLNSLVYGGAGLVTMASNAGASAARQASEAGADPEQIALAYAGNMAAEYLTEKLPMDEIAKNLKGGISTKGVKAFVKSLKDSALYLLVTEGAGEGIAEISEEKWDEYVMGELSNHDTTVAAYIESGMTEDEAETQYSKDVAERVLTAVFSGVLMGTGTAVATKVIGKVASKTAGENATGNTDQTTHAVVAPTAEEQHDAFEAAAKGEPAGVDAAQQETDPLMQAAQEVAGNKAVTVTAQTPSAETIAQADARTAAKGADAAQMDTSAVDGQGVALENAAQNVLQKDTQGNISAETRTQEQAERAALEGIQEEARKAGQTAEAAQAQYKTEPTEENKAAADAAQNAWRNALERSEQAVKSYAETVAKLQQEANAAAKTETKGAENALEVATEGQQADTLEQKALEVAAQDNSTLISTKDTETITPETVTAAQNEGKADTKGADTAAQETDTLAQKTTETATQDNSELIKQDETSTIPDAAIAENAAAETGRTEAAAGSAVDAQQESGGKQVKTLADIAKLTSEEKQQRTTALAKELNIQTAAQNKSGTGLVIAQAARDLDETQKANLRLVDLTAKMHGLRVVLQDGVANGRANAKYDAQTDVIYLDTGAKDFYTRYMSHELVHYIRRYNETGYKALAELFEHYARETEGYDVDERVNALIKKYETQGKKLTYETAKEELVANSVLDMIANKQTVRDLYVSDQSTFSKIKGWIENQLANIKQMLTKMHKGSLEAQVMLKTQEQYETVHAIFEEILFQADTNRRLLNKLNGKNLEGIGSEYVSSMRKAFSDDGRKKSLHTLAANILKKSGDAVNDDNMRVLIQTAEKVASGKIKGSYAVIVKNAGLTGWGTDNTELNKAFAVLQGQTAEFDNENIAYSMKDTEETEEFKRWFGNSKVVDEDGKPLIMYHGTPYGGYTVFKDWQYFTRDKEYADKYHNPSASSVRGRYNPATNPTTYAVYLRAEKPFDTRDPKIRKIWKEKFYDHYSRTPLTEKGLPDWTDGIDLVEFIEDEDYDFDAIILDEGAVGGYGDDVKSRGISVVVRSSKQIKSATDNIGTFDPDNPDIRYSLKDEDEIEEEYIKYAIKDGDERSEEEIRQEYQEAVEPMAGGDDADGDIKTERSSGKERNEKSKALDTFQETLVKQALEGNETKYGGNISDVAKLVQRETGGGISTVRANKILRVAYAQLDEALKNRATGAEMQEAVDTAFEIARQAAEEAIENQKVQYQAVSEEDEFLEQLRATPFSLNKGQQAEVRNAYESVAAYRRAAFGSLQVVSEKTTKNQLEDMWEEISAKTGLPEDTNADDMPLALLSYVAERREAKKKAAELTNEEKAAADVIAQDALLAYYANRKSTNVQKSAKQLARENERLRKRIEALKQQAATAKAGERQRIDTEIQKATAGLQEALREERQFSRDEAKRVDVLATRIYEERKKHEAEKKDLLKKLWKEQKKREKEKADKEQKKADLIREEYEGVIAPMMQGEKDPNGKWTKAQQQEANERKKDNAQTMATIQDLERAQEESVKQAAEALKSGKSKDHVARYTGSVTELAKQIRTLAGGDGMTEKQLASRIKGVFSDLEESKRTGETKTAVHDALKNMTDTMRDLLADKNLEDDADYQKVKALMRAERFYLTREQQDAVRSVYQSMAIFRKQSFGVMSIGTERTAKQTLQDVWQKLTTIDKEAFPANTAAADMPDTLMSYLNEKRGQGVELSPEYMTLSNNAALAALADYYRQQSGKYTAQDADKLAHKADRLEKLARQLQEKMERDRGDYLQSLKNYREERERTKNRQNIRKLGKELRAAIASPTENKYVPVGYMQTILKVTEALTNADRQEINNAFLKWQNANTQMQNDQDYFNQRAFDPDLGKRIAEIVEILDRKTVDQLNADETRYVYETLRGATTALQNARKLIGKAKNKNAFETATQGISEIRKVKGNDAHKWLQSAVYKYTTSMKSGVRAFRMFAGFAKDSVLEERAEALNEGQHKQNKIKQEASSLFRDLIADGKDKAKDRRLQKELAGFAGRNAEWVDTGVKVSYMRGTELVTENLKMTRGMRASLYMHSKNEQNMNHVTHGGVTVPDMALYKKGDLQEAYARGATMQLTRDEVAKIIAGMSDYEKAWCERWMRLEPMLSKWINDTSLQLNGFKKAIVEQYFPIKTDRNFLKRDFESIVNDASIEGMGMLKARVNGSNPIMLEDITNVVNRQIDNTSKYAGLAIPVRDFNTVYNATMPGYAASMKQVMAQKWGKTGQDYIENLMADIQGARKTETTVWDTARGKFAQAKLNLNISTALKQVSGALTITPYTGYSAMLKGMRTIGKGMKDTDFIGQWTATNWARGDNRAKTEIGGVGRDFTVMDRAPKLDWLNRMDAWTMRKIWTACEYAVDENGSKGYDAETDRGKAYYEKVAELFDKCVDETQPSSGVMQRTDIARNPSTLTKSLTMFMGQGLQNFGVLTDTFGEMRARAADFKANASAENQAAFKAAKTRFASAVTSQVSAAVVTALCGLVAKMLLSKMNPYRDDKEEITAQSVTEGIVDDVLSNLAGTVIGGQEVYNLISSSIQGETPYDIEASGLSTVNEIYQGTAKFLNAAGAALDGEKTVEERFEKVRSAGWTLGKSIAEWFGIPVANLENLVNGAINNTKDLVSGELLSFNASMKDMSLSTGAEYMAAALNVGDMNEYTRLFNRLRKQGKTDTQIMTALKKEYRENDKRIIAAAEALNVGDLDTYETMAGEVTSLGFAPSTVRDMVSTKAAALKKEAQAEDTEDTAAGEYQAYTTEEALTASIKNSDGTTGLYTTSMLNGLLENGDTQAAQKVRRALIKENGQTKVDSAIQKKFKSLIVDAWEAGDATEYNRLKNILKAVGFTESTIASWVRGTKSSSSWSSGSSKSWSSSSKGWNSGGSSWSSSFKGWNK